MSVVPKRLCPDGIRRWSMGRLVLTGGALKDNIFMSSELACAGRPMDFNNVTLPRQRDLLLPEPLDVDSGILLGERPKRAL